MSYMLPHLHNGWQVDQAILSEEDRVVVSNKSLRVLLWPDNIPTHKTIFYNFR